MNEFLPLVPHGDDTPETPYISEDYPHLKAALDAIGTREETLLISDSPRFGASELTVPDNVTLQFLDHGLIVVGEGETLTVVGPIVAGVRQIFDVSKTGKVVFGSRVSECYPQWFGATGNGKTDDVLPLNQLFGALLKGGLVVFPPGSCFLASRGIDVMYDNITILGYGATLFMEGRSSRTAADVPEIAKVGDAQLRVWNGHGELDLPVGEGQYEYELKTPLRNFRCLGLALQNTGGLDTEYLGPAEDGRGPAVALLMWVVEDFEIRDCVFLDGSAEQLCAAAKKGIIANNTWRNCNSTAITMGLDDVLVIGNTMIDVFQGFEAGGRGRITNNYLHLTHRPQSRPDSAGIWLDSGTYRTSVSCEISENRIIGYGYNAIQVVDTGEVPNAFEIVEIRDNIIRPADPARDPDTPGSTGSSANGIYLTRTNGTYIIEGNVFDDIDTTVNYQNMIFVNRYTPWGRESSGSSGTYIIRNNTGIFRRQHADTMILVPDKLQARILDNHAFLVGDAAFNNDGSSAWYRQMIYVGAWDARRLTLCGNRLNGESRFVDRSTEPVITLANHDTLYFDCDTKPVTEIHASGLFTVVNVRAGSIITLQHGPKIITLSGQPIALGYGDTARFAIDNPQGDKIRQLP